MKAIAILIGLSILAVAGACVAGENPGYILDDKAAQVNPSVKMALHVLPHGTAGCGKLIPSIPNFDGIIRTQSTYTDLDAFMVIFDYDSISVYEYTLSWPAGWGSCETSVCVGEVGVGTLANPGDPGLSYYFTCRVSGVNGAPFLPVAFHWLAPSSDGEITILPQGQTGNLGVVDCRGDSDPTKAQQWIQAVYNAGVNVDPTEYFGPDVPATEPTSWGSIKSLFR